MWKKTGFKSNQHEICRTPLHDTSRSTNKSVTSATKKYTLESFSEYIGTSNVVKEVFQAAGPEYRRRHVL